MAATLDTRFLDDLAPSLGVMLQRRIARTPDLEAFRFLSGEKWVSRTWREAGVEIAEAAAGLLALGMKPEDRVAIISRTRYEWIVADLGIMCAGGATTTVYPTTAAEDAAYILDDAGCRFAIVEDAEQLAKVRGAEHPALEHVIVMDAAAAADSILSFNELCERGRTYLAEHPEAVTDATAVIGPDALATLIYTSGTTGRPKGVRLTHRSVGLRG